jgi:hypothetical protein
MTIECLSARIRSGFGICLVLLIAVPTVTLGQALQRFTAFAVNNSSHNTGANERMQIVVNRWSTEAEREVTTTTTFPLSSSQHLDIVIKRAASTPPVGTPAH